MIHAAVAPGSFDSADDAGAPAERDDRDALALAPREESIAARYSERFGIYPAIIRCVPGEGAGEVGAHEEIGIVR